MLRTLLITASLATVAACGPASVAPVRTAAPAAASAQPVDPGAAMGRAFDALNEGQYLQAVDQLRASLPNPPDRQSPFYGLWWQIHPFITNVPDMSAVAEQTPQPLSEAVMAELRSARAADAIQTIVERARNTRIVILNEAHHAPRDRAFGLAVARALRPLGYTVLAAESFSNSLQSAESEAQMAAMAQVGHPRLNDGMYLKDPVFGDFVRQSLALGYRPVAYEQAGPGSGIPAREQAQAENLVTRIFSRDPAAKVFIYVGYSHAAEAPLGSAATEWMAARLKRMTGIDPLTIEQSTLSEYNEDGRQRRYHQLVAPLATNGPVILLNASGEPIVLGPYAGKMDLQVVHPLTRMRQGRPDWLWAMGRQAVPIPRALRPRRGRRLVQAFIASESADAIPVDQVIAEAGRPLPPLLVPPNVAIRYAAQDAAAP